VAYHQQPEPDTEAEQNEAIFNIGVFRISNQARSLQERPSELLRTIYPVRPSIGTILFFVPFEQKRSHTYSVTTT
jgi:hypothetical protein